MAIVVCSAAVPAVLLVWALRAFGAASVWWSFLIVWLPMTWLGTVSRIATPRLPARWHQLRRGERSGRLYERLGVRVAKRLLRRGPLAVFNPHLHLPAQPDPARLARLEQHMCDAEASHTILLVLTFGVVVNAAIHGWWVAAACTLAFNLLMNGYPVMLQRYNRALLHQRFDGS